MYENENIILYGTELDDNSNRADSLERFTRILIHEIGHAVDHHLKTYSNSDAWKNARRDISGAASEYGKQSPVEDYGETFASWVSYSNGLGYKTPYDERVPDNARLDAVWKSLNGLCAARIPC